MDHGPPVKFTKDSLIVGPGDSGIATSASRLELVVDGTVELHLAFAQEKRIKRVSLTFSSIPSSRASRVSFGHADPYIHISKTHS